MPMDYLRSIENAEFPLQVQDPKKINNLAVLKAAGLVRAEFVRTGHRALGSELIEVATVLGITHVGRKALAEDQKDDSFPVSKNSG